MPRHQGGLGGAKTWVALLFEAIPADRQVRQLARLDMSADEAAVTWYA